jgi:hypothetical protein
MRTAQEAKPTSRVVSLLGLDDEFAASPGEGGE